mmetsp:Transcript_5118/g.14878  ORF Transcript_5118/g.14878 Transcript_5118/m.14878 type:complete len:406 (+) Transcript_5118:85-1302(+)
MSLAYTLRSFHRGGNSRYGSAASSLSGDDSIDNSSCSTLSLASSMRSLKSRSPRRKGSKPKPAAKIVRVHEVDDDDTITIHSKDYDDDESLYRLLESQSSFNLSKICSNATQCTVSSTSTTASSAVADAVAALQEERRNGILAEDNATGITTRLDTIISIPERSFHHRTKQHRVAPTIALPDQDVLAARKPQSCDGISSNRKSESMPTTVARPLSGCSLPARNASLARGRSTTNRARSGTRAGQGRRRRRGRTRSRVGSRTKDVRRETTDSVTEFKNASRRYKVHRTKSSGDTKVRNTESKSKSKIDSNSNSISSISGHRPSDHGHRRDRRRCRRSEVAPRPEYTSTVSLSSFQHATRTVSPFRESFGRRTTSLACVLESPHATSRSLRRGQRSTHSRRPIQDRS